MSVLVFIELNEGTIKKSALEAVSYAVVTASKMNAQCEAIILEPCAESEAQKLSAYGVSKITLVKDEKLKFLDAAACSKAISFHAKKMGASVIVFSMSDSGKAIAPVLSAQLQAGLVAGAIDYPDTTGGKFIVKKNVFSGKAFAFCEIKSEIKIVSLVPNAVSPVLNNVTVQIETVESGLTESDYKIKIEKQEKATGEISLTDADIVVSGGRGMKGPENWGMLEEMAKILGAATACSRPVADTHWRPHHEHVGQTGFTVRPNLYIAIGISGAIQHLAGVNGSKIIVVINKDAEAPFFKAADYGIVGDAFEVVPKLNEAFKKFKQHN